MLELRVTNFKGKTLIESGDLKQHLRVDLDWHVGEDEFLDGKSVSTWSSIGIYAFNDMASKYFFCIKI